MYNPKHYRKRQWQDYRIRIWELDNRQCVRCGISIDNPQKAQIHHKIYLNGKMPWEYDDVDCECLCAKCHLEEHGKIRPSSDWVYIGCTTYDNYGDTTCDLCGSELKYEHEIWHPKWGTMNVGIGCCKNLTSTHEMQEIRRQQNYLMRLENPKRWIHHDSQIWTRKFDGYQIKISLEDDSFRIYIEGKRGRSKHATFDAAIGHLYNLFYSGEIDEIFEQLHISIPKARMKRLKAYKMKSQTN